MVKHLNKFEWREFVEKYGENLSFEMVKIANCKICGNPPQTFFVAKGFLISCCGNVAFHKSFEAVSQWNHLEFINPHWSKSIE